MDLATIGETVGLFRFLSTIFTAVLALAVIFSILQWFFPRGS